MGDRFFLRIKGLLPVAFVQMIPQSTATKPLNHMKACRFDSSRMHTIPTLPPRTGPDIRLTQTLSANLASCVSSPSTCGVCMTPPFNLKGAGGLLCVPTSPWEGRRWSNPAWVFPSVTSGEQIAGGFKESYESAVTGPALTSPGAVKSGALCRFPTVWKCLVNSLAC